MHDGRTDAALTQALFARARDGMCLVAPDDTVARVNGAWVRYAGASGPGVGTDLLARCASELREAARECARTRARVEVRRHPRRIEGRETWWEGHVSLVPMDDGAWLLVTVTERSSGPVQAEAPRERQVAIDPLRSASEALPAPGGERRAYEQLSRHAAVLQAISDTSLDVIFAKDRAGRLQFANPAALALIGKPLHEVLGRTDAELLDDPDAARRVMENDRRIMDSGLPEDVEERVPLPDGTERTWLSRKTPHLDSLGNVVGLLGISRDITDRNRGADALRESEQRLRAAHERLRVLVESTPLALVEWDAEYRVVGYSGRAQEMFGWSPEEVLGKRIDEIPWVPEEDWPAVRGVMRDMSSGARPTNVSANRNVRKDGRIVSCEWYNSTLHDEGGRLVAVLSLVHDVTERVQAVKALRESEQRLLAILNDAAVGIVEVDAGDRFVAVNARFCAMMGYSRDELVGKTIHEITAPEDAGITRDLNARATASDLRAFEYEKRYVRRDGSRIWVHVTVSVVRDEGGRLLRTIGTAEDISDRKRAESALRDSEARFGSVVENQSEGLIIFDADGNTLFQNPASLRIRGVAPGADGLSRHEDLPVTWRGWDQQGQPLRFEEWPISRVLRKERVRDQVVQAERVETGHRFWASYNGAPVLDAEGRLAYGFITIRDITAQVQAEGEERRARAALLEVNERLQDADRRKDEFLGMLSHELRNPLAPIRNSLYILEHAEPNGQQARRAKDVANRQITHLTRLVDDLLDVTRIARGKIELRRANLDIGALLRRTAEDYRTLMRDRGLELAVAVPDEPLVVHGDDTRLAQVLGNLLSNSAKFTPAGGRVTLAVQRSGGLAVVRVRDTGVGISPDLLPTIFDPFIQAEQTLDRSAGGLGLGLALVRGLTELHGGRASATSGGPGSGTTFTVELPLTEAAEAPRPPERAAGASRAYRVLVVDDTVDAAESLAELVRLFGHEVEVAYDGPSAVAAADARRPDVVLCDIGLPGMDGYAVARMLRARLHGAVQLVAVSGYAQPDDVKMATEAGFDAHVAKPPDPARIQRLFR